MLYSNQLNQHDNAVLKTVLPNEQRFIFQLGLDFEALEPLRQRVDEAYLRLVSVGYLPNLENIIQPIDFTSIYSTNRIEGGEISWELTEKLLKAEAREPSNEQELRITNLAKAYDYVKQYYNLPGETQLKAPMLYSGLFAMSIPERNFVFKISEILFSKLNKMILNNLPVSNEEPGEYRDNKKYNPTKVGHESTDGVYKPPQKKEFIQQLMLDFVNWVNSEPMSQLSALYRAPLIHYYYELIHPFADGNGRVGRLMELIILGNVGYEYISKLMPKYYFDNLNRYFTLFNKCRKSKEKYPNTEFVKFFLEGMLTNINYLQDQINKELGKRYFQQLLDYHVRMKKINKRQFDLLSIMFKHQDEVKTLSQLKEAVWYQGLYHNFSTKTQKRDLKALEKFHMLNIDDKQNIIIPYINPAIEVSKHPFCSS